MNKSHYETWTHDRLGSGLDPLLIALDNIRDALDVAIETDNTVHQELLQDLLHTTAKTIDAMRVGPERSAK